VVGGGNRGAVDSEDLLELVAVSFEPGASADEGIRRQCVKDGEFARVDQRLTRSSPPLACQCMDSLGAKQFYWYESAMFPMLSTASTARLA